MGWVLVGIIWLASMIFSIRYVSQRSPKEIAQWDELKARYGEHEIPKKRELTEIELLRNIERHTENSAYVLKRFHWSMQILAVFWFISCVIELVVLFSDNN